MQKKALFLSLVILLTLLSYANSFNNKLVWDDEYLIEKNLYIRSSGNIFRIFTTDIGAGSGKTYYYYLDVVTVGGVKNRFSGIISRTTPEPER